jgi:hypothetical protein
VVSHHPQEKKTVGSNTATALVLFWKYSSAVCSVMLYHVMCTYPCKYVGTYREIKDKAFVSAMSLNILGKCCSRNSSGRYRLFY